MGKITLEIYNRSITIDIDDDINSDDTIKDFCSLMFAQGYMISSIISSLKDTAEDLEEQIKLCNK